MFSIHPMNSTFRQSFDQARFYEVPFKRDFPNPHFPSSGTSTYSTLKAERKYEEIAQDPEASHDKWNSFEHFKSVRSDPVLSRHKAQRQRDFGFDVVNTVDGLDPLYGVVDGGVYGALGRFDGGLIQYVDRRFDGGFIPAPNGINDLNQRALRAMIPEIKARLSILNSLIELKDFKSLPETVVKIAGFIFKSGKTLRQLLRTTSDSYLQLKFNILPLLSDIAGLNASLYTYYNRMNRLLEEEGRIKRRHFTFSYFEQERNTAREDILFSFDPRFWFGSPVDGPIVGSRSCITDASVFHAEVEYNYSFTQYQREHAHVLALLDMIGINLNPAIIWNAIPWSFVVDWVAGVGRWLDSFKRTNMKPMVHIGRYLWSIKRHRVIDVQTKVGNGSTVFSFATPPWSHVANINQWAYRRSVGIPSTSSIVLSGLNLNEFSLGAALAFTRGRAPKTRSWSNR
jgi:hypothetical protein